MWGFTKEIDYGTQVKWPGFKYYKTHPRYTTTNKRVMCYHMLGLLHKCPCDLLYKWVT
jgi:hypothetical protein